MSSQHGHNFETGQIFEGKYRILKELGRGGFGMVYLAYQESMDRHVALKVLNPGQGIQGASARERFLREVKFISKLRHPNTVTIHDYGETNTSILYMVLEYVTGETLKDILRREGAQELKRGIKLVSQINKSLAEAHVHGIVHRDLKPANIMVTNLETEKDFVKVLDFGVARLLGNDDSELTMQGVPEGERALIGTPRYMSPEQVRGENLTGASDLYSLGLIMYEVFVGEPAVQGDTTMGLITQQISPEPLMLKSLQGLHPAIQAIIRKSTQKSLGMRYRNAEELADDLEHALHLLISGSPYQGVGTDTRGNYLQPPASPGALAEFHHSQSDFRLLNDSYIQNQRVPPVSLKTRESMHPSAQPLVDDSFDPINIFEPTGIQTPKSPQDPDPFKRPSTPFDDDNLTKDAQAWPKKPLMPTTKPPGSHPPQAPVVEMKPRKPKPKPTTSTPKPEQELPLISHKSILEDNDVETSAPNLTIDKSVKIQEQKKRKKARAKYLTTLLSQLVNSMFQLIVVGIFTSITFLLFVIIVSAFLAAYMAFSLQITLAFLAAIAVIFFVAWAEGKDSTTKQGNQPPGAFWVQTIGKSALFYIVLALLLCLALPNQIIESLYEEPAWLSSMEDPEAEELSWFGAKYMSFSKSMADGIEATTKVIGTYDDTPAMTYLPVPDPTRPPEPKPKKKRDQSLQKTTNEGDYVEW